MKKWIHRSRVRRSLFISNLESLYASPQWDIAALGERYGVMKCTSATEYLHFYLIPRHRLRLDKIANLQIISYSLLFRFLFFFFCMRRISSLSKQLKRKRYSSRIKELEYIKKGALYPSIFPAFFVGLLLDRELDYVIPFVYEMTPSSRIADV